MENKDKLPVLETLMKGTGVYFLVLGALLLFNPALPFRLFGEANPAPYLMWRWLGAIAAAYGLGLALGATQPSRNWRLVFVGFLATLIVALLTGAGLWRETLSATLGWSALIALLIALIPLNVLLKNIANEPAGEVPPEPLPKDLNLENYKTHEGRSLASLSNESPVLLVLLRHLGCTFCRETLADIASRRQEIESAGARIVFAHMGEDEKAAYLFERYRLEDIPRISDPDARLYRALGLPRASFMQVYGPGMWKYVIQSVLLDGHGMGQIVGDRFQMPGAFLIHRDTVVGGFRHQRISDHPDYLSIVRCASPAVEIPY